MEESNKQVCTECGSDKLLHKAWVDGEGNFSDWFEEDDVYEWTGWCNDCDEEVELELFSSFKGRNGIK